METGLYFFAFSVSKDFNFNIGQVTADLSTEGKLHVKSESLITEVTDRRSSTSLASKEDGSGSGSQVLTAVLFNTSSIVDSDTG